jgi:hypothetical protein
MVSTVQLRKHATARGGRKRKYAAVFVAFPLVCMKEKRVSILTHLPLRCTENTFPGSNVIVVATYSAIVCGLCSLP